MNARWWSLAAGIALTLLLMFFAASAAGVAIDDAAPILHAAGPLAAVAGFLLLVADVFLPIPSSLVMVAHGTLFGAAGGALLSLAGSIASTLTAFAIGRAGTPAIRRFVTPGQHERASALLARWGVVAVAVTRPVPILAETVAIMAGSSRISWTEATLAAAAGSVVPAAVYAWVGAHAGSAANHAVIFGGVLVATAILWWVGDAQRRGRAPS
jgi:uncharacterized membrane protein YdjX (TVP38/TMEM64 family)